MNNNNQMKDDWIFLKDIYDILMNGKVLNTPKDEKIVEFLYPEELMVFIFIMLNFQFVSCIMPIYINS